MNFSHWKGGAILWEEFSNEKVRVIQHGISNTIALENKRERRLAAKVMGLLKGRQKKLSSQGWVLSSRASLI